MAAQAKKDAYDALSPKEKQKIADKKERKIEKAQKNDEEKDLADKFIEGGMEESAAKLKAKRQFEQQAEEE